MRNKKYVVSLLMNATYRLELYFKLYCLQKKVLIIFHFHRFLKFYIIILEAMAENLIFSVLYIYQRCLCFSFQKKFHRVGTFESPPIYTQNRYTARKYLGQHCILWNLLVILQ